MKNTLNTYELPISEKYITQVVIDNESHKGSYEGSIDYAVALGAEVLAAANGIVTRVRDDSIKYGTDPSFGPEVNYITLKHANDELSEYLHLAKGSAVVKVGYKVVAGQHIANTGLSGWMYAPHLHFMVYPKANSSSTFQCMRVRFNS